MNLTLYYILILLKGIFFSLPGSLEKDPTSKNQKNKNKKDCQKRNGLRHVMLQLVHVVSASTMAGRSCSVNKAIFDAGKFDL